MKVSKVKKICNVIIIDASGSMQNKENDVKGGLKSLFESIRNDTDAVQHTIVCQFENKVNTLVNSINVKDISDDIANNYKVGGGTALYDAIGTAFSMVPSGYDGVFVNIITDGEENASSKYRREDIKKLILSKNEDKWGIVFMGTTQDAILQAKDFGIKNTMMFQDSSEGMMYANSKTLSSRGVYTNSVYSGQTVTTCLTD